MDTRDIIRRKTLSLLLAKGYDGVSISDIQQATGLARGLLYHYFDNKDELFIEVTEQYFMEQYCFDKESLKHKSVGELIGFIICWYDQLFRDLLDKTDMKITLLNSDFLFYQTAQHSEHFALEYKKRREVKFAIWKTALLNSFRKGELRSGLNLESITRHFVYITEGVAFGGDANRNMQDVVYEMDKGLQDFFEIIKR